MRKVILALGLALLSCLPLACVPGPADEGNVTELTYTAPFEVGIEVGANLPGTGIRYEGSDEEGARVLIDGQTALKRKGDSLDWKGSPVADVDLNLSLRVLWFTADTLRVAGTAKVTVHNPVVQAASIPEAVNLTVANAPVTYSIARDHFIPGTLIQYLGKEELGAKLGGVEGYPYRKTADSILWTGKLKGNVYLRMTLRVVYFTDDVLSTGGLATLFIVP